jgi:hypothetical protein
MQAPPSTDTRGGRAYHDIYDFSVFPVSLGDMITWGVNSALRAIKAGRDKVHVHVVCDPHEAEFNPLQANTYLVDLFVAEAMPAFYSHPLFSGLTIHRSHDDFREAFQPIIREDEVARQVYEKHERHFHARRKSDQMLPYFWEYCAQHAGINAYFRETGSYPKVRYLADCLVDWKALQSQFPQRTFWVTVQFRLRKLDTGMTLESEHGLLRDASFAVWHEFIREAAARIPAVRFVVVGRLQEKPLELLRLPNVVALRALGMNLAHEITALLNSDLFLGSPSGFAQAAHFSDVPYDVFNCLPLGCENYGIPFGADRLPFATERQRLHYGQETPEMLFECLEKAYHQREEKTGALGELEAGRARSTDRFFFHGQQREAELSSILAGCALDIALAVERGDYSQARAQLQKLGESFPDAAQWPDFRWLADTLSSLTATPAPSAPEREELLWNIASFCHPPRLVRWSGRHFESQPDLEGMRVDGWCERTSQLVFAPTRPGDLVFIQVRRIATGEPVGVTVQVGDQPKVPHVLLNELGTMEIPVLGTNIPTRVRLEADRTARLPSHGEKEYAFMIESAGVITKRPVVQDRFRGDKKSPRAKLISGIYSDGRASTLARVRLDNPHPAGTPVMVRVIGTVPLTLRFGQHFRIQVNDGPAEEAFLRGKHFSACVACADAGPHLAIILRFWDSGANENMIAEDRAQIESIDLLPLDQSKLGITTGWAGMIEYLGRAIPRSLEKKRARKAAAS